MTRRSDTAGATGAGGAGGTGAAGEGTSGGRTDDGQERATDVGRARQPGGATGSDRKPAMRTDARRNLRHVLSAARDVFGEQGYDAPIEEVARRAQVGVGTVYRRFPNKDALVQYIAEQETRQLTERALQALAGDGDPWSALEDFVRYSAASGTSRLLPELFAAATAQLAGGGPAAVPGPGPVAREGTAGQGTAGQDGPRSGGGVPDDLTPERVPQPRSAPENAAGSGRSEPQAQLSGPARELLAVVGRLVERAREAGRLRADATVADIMVVIATSPPVLADPRHRAAVSGRLLDILLQGLRTERF